MDKSYAIKFNDLNKEINQLTDEAVEDIVHGMTIPRNLETLRKLREEQHDLLEELIANV